MDFEVSLIDQYPIRANSEGLSSRKELFTYAANS